MTPDQLADAIQKEEGEAVFIVYKCADGSYSYSFRAQDSEELFAAVEESLDRVAEHDPTPAPTRH